MFVPPPNPPLFFLFLFVGGGVVQVTADGDIVYVFPSLQTSAMGTGAAALGGGMDRKEAERLQGLKVSTQTQKRKRSTAVHTRIADFVPVVWNGDGRVSGYSTAPLERFIHGSGVYVPLTFIYIYINRLM